MCVLSWATNCLKVILYTVTSTYNVEGLRKLKILAILDSLVICVFCVSVEFS